MYVSMITGWGLKPKSRLTGSHSGFRTQQRQSDFRFCLSKFFWLNLKDMHVITFWSYIICFLEYVTYWDFSNLIQQCFTSIFIITQKSKKFQSVFCCHSSNAPTLISLTAFQISFIVFRQDKHRPDQQQPDMSVSCWKSVCILWYCAGLSKMSSIMVNVHSCSIGETDLKC